MRVRLEAAVDRYGAIAERWPRTVTVEGTEAQVRHFIDFMSIGVEPGCDDFLVPADPVYDCGAQYCDDPECGTHGANYKIWREECQ